MESPMRNQPRDLADYHPVQTATKDNKSVLDARATDASVGYPVLFDSQVSLLVRYFTTLL